MSGSLPSQKPFVVRTSARSTLRTSVRTTNQSDRISIAIALCNIAICTDDAIETHT